MKTQSIKNERAVNGKHKYIDLTNQRFGKLTVLSPTDKRMDQGSVVWLCKCDCGNLKEVSARRLNRGKVRSCGCLSDPPPKDYIGKKFGRLVVAEYMGRKRKVTENSEVTITYWKCNCECGNTVIVAQSELQSGSTKSCGCLKKDHAISALKLVDNTSVTNIERSRSGLRCTNSSGYTGVCYDKRTESWSTYINFKKKRYWLGRYPKIEDAVKARLRAEEMHENFLEWYYNEYIAEGKER